MVGIGDKISGTLRDKLFRSVSVAVSIPLPVQPGLNYQQREAELFIIERGLEGMRGRDGGCD